MITQRDILELRSRAHAAFDQLWKRKICTRSFAYYKLSVWLGIEVQDAHFKFFTRAQCLRVIEELGRMDVPHLRDRARRQASAVKERHVGREHKAAITQMRLAEREECYE